MAISLAAACREPASPDAPPPAKSAPAPAGAARPPERVFGGREWFDKTPVRVGGLPAMAFQCGDPGIRLVETRAVSTTYPADIAFEERELLARHIEALRPGNRWVRHGPCETFYPFNKVAVGQNRDGVPDGEFRILQDGRLVETQTYRAGQLLE